MVNTVEFCKITLSKCQILKSFNVNSNKNLHTGVDISANIVHNYISGVVLYTGTNGYHKSVIVQYNYKYCFRYDNMIELYVYPGDILPSGVEIGKADKFVHFECLYSQSDDSRFPVRVGSETYYKIDPTPFLYDDTLLPDPNSIYEVN